MLNPSAPDRRRFDAAISLFMAAVGLSLLGVWQADWRWIVWLLAVVLTMAAAAALIWPHTFRPIGKLANQVASGLAWSFSMVLLTFVFVLVLTPYGWLLKLFGHDPLGQRSDTAEATYWKDRERSNSQKSYFRQY